MFLVSHVKVEALWRSVRSECILRAFCDRLGTLSGAILPEEGYHSMALRFVFYERRESKVIFVRCAMQGGARWRSFQCTADVKSSSADGGGCGAQLSILVHTCRALRLRDEEGPSRAICGPTWLAP